MTGWTAALAGVVIVLLYAVALERRKLRRVESHLQTATADLQRLQDSCSRLAPGNVVDRMISDGVEAAAERKEVTALFADIVGYTALAERLEPRDLVRVLNGYYQAMSDAILEHRGRIATFLGDGLLAYFGAFEPNPWQCDDAVRAALSMRTALATYNRKLDGQGLPRLGIGIGLNRGVGLAGFVGSRERMEYAFVGRTVNVAARVQSLTRTHRVDILVTDSVREKLDPRFELRPMPPTAAKGLTDPLVTYAVERLRPAAADFGK
jgi:adenylate cyclase